MKRLTSIADELSQKMGALRFGPPVTHVYNPLEYARRAHHQYLNTYGRGKGRVLMLGMNPGPWGMAQTGVPFGDVSMVRDFLGISATVEKPRKEHAKRPVEGYQCSRGEVSGQRLWGWARDTWGSPEKFFNDFFILNYCPLAFMESTGRNRTPDKLPVHERSPLLKTCDEALVQMIDALEPRFVIGIGNFAHARLRAALADCEGDPAIGCILHPSPASPLANKDWAGTVTKQLAGLGITVPR